MDEKTIIYRNNIDKKVLDYLERAKKVYGIAKKTADLGPVEYIDINVLEVAKMIQLEEQADLNNMILEGIADRM